VSATLTQEVLEISQKFMNDPVRILVPRDEITVEGMKQVKRGTEKGEEEERN